MQHICISALPLSRIPVKAALESARLGTPRQARVASLAEPSAGASGRLLPVDWTGLAEPMRWGLVDQGTLYRRAAELLGQFHMDLDPREIVGVTGLMGAGKTELARAIAGVDPFDAGEVFVHGQKAGELQATSCKLQAASSKLQAPSLMLQAPSPRQACGACGLRLAA